jgi:hypothetical protein
MAWGFFNFALIPKRQIAGSSRVCDSVQLQAVSRRGTEFFGVPLRVRELLSES